MYSTWFHQIRDTAGQDLKQLDALTPDGLKIRCQYRKGDAEHDAVVINFYPHKPAGNQRA